MDCAKAAATVSDEAETLVLVEDRSGSMEQSDWIPSRMDGAKKASCALVDEKLDNCPRDYVGVVSYASRARVDLAPVEVRTDAEKIKRAINGLNPAGKTDIEAALKTAEQALQQDGDLRGRVARRGAIQSVFGREKTKPSRTRRILLFSDGHHNGSPRKDVLKVAKRLKRDGVTICCIGIGGETNAVDEDLLKHVASLGLNEEPLYWYIGYERALVKKCRELSTCIRIVDDK